jgi:trk system potassium uptake protein TrkH
MKLTPAKFILIFFIIMILFGTILLWLPISVEKSSSVNFLDRIFTATSAVCVTGLTVVDISKAYTTFGQVIILFCIQIGGLGYMVFGSLMLIFFGRVSLGQKSVLSESLNLNNLSQSKQINSVIKQILIFTFCFEILGAIILSVKFYLSNITLKKSLYYGIFHSISAFCNSGFSLFSTSFIEYRNDVVINVIISLLIIFGGIGFVVGLDLIQKLYKRQQLLFHSKIVLMMTIILILFGAISIFMLNYNKAFLNITVKEKILISLFQSITSRTAGFNTVIINNLSELSILVIMVLMFIGASPGGTGGGIKTTTFFVVTYFIYTFSRGEKDLTIFKRRINIDLVIKSFVIFISSLIYIILMTTLLVITSKFSIKECLFETISAFGTVGLSLGITPNLDNLSKILLIITMFLGRVGSLTLLTALLFREPKEVKYLVEDIAIG